MKFKIIKNQQSSVYDDNWITIEIDNDKWFEWEKYNYENFKKWRRDSECNLPSYDCDECRECEILSREHLDDFIDFTFKSL